MTVGEMLGRMSSRELTEWQAYFQLEREEAPQKELAEKARAGLEERLARRRRR